MNDVIEKIGNSVIQHGENNDRIYLMKLCIEEASELLVDLNLLAYKHKYTKIFTKIPSSARELLINHGYLKEAYIPGFFAGKEDGIFMSKYFDYERKNNKNKEELSNVLKVCFNKAEKVETILNLKEGFDFRRIKPKDAYQAANLYKRVFETYPFPIHDHDYLLKTMNENTEYFGIWQNNNLIAISSLEKDLDSQNAEMTDFAVLPEYRGNKFADFLLKEMEKAAKKQNIKTAYTIARAVSYGMNICFAKSGYSFAGTLFNNTNICGNLESMNVWYKTIKSCSKAYEINNIKQAGLFKVP